MKRPNPRLKWRILLAKSAKDVGALATLATVCWGAYEWALHWRQDRQNDLIAQVSTYGNFRELIDRSHKIEIQVNKWMIEVWPKYQSSEAQRALMNKYGSGERIYYSSEMTTFRKIHSYFEELGIVVNSGAMPFDAFFDAVTFPTNYERETRSFHQLIGDNWFGNGHGIPAFTENMQKLSHRYAVGRAATFAHMARNTHADKCRMAWINSEAAYWTRYASELQSIIED